MKNIKKSKEEAIQFDNYLKEQCPDLYLDALGSNGKTMLLIRLLVKTKFHGYGFVMRLLHALGYYT